MEEEEEEEEWAFVINYNSSKHDVTQCLWAFVINYNSSKHDVLYLVIIWLHNNNRSSSSSSSNGSINSNYHKWSLGSSSMCCHICWSLLYNIWMTTIIFRFIRPLLLLLLLLLLLTCWIVFKYYILYNIWREMQNVDVLRVKLHIITIIPESAEKVRSGGQEMKY